MIEQIDIPSFGSFSGLEWKTAVRDSGDNVLSFQRLNIIYGRNYSGKTTLSRIFRALETRKLPTNYSESCFSIKGNNGTVTPAGLLTHTYDVRVYNRDFVADNLSFLINQDIGGAIKSFAIVGEKNKEIDENIATIEAKLGSVESNAGLRFSLEAKRKDCDRTKAEYARVSSALDEKLRTHANQKIKKNRDYGMPVYNIDNIRRDIEVTKGPGFVALTPEKQSAKHALLKQEAMPGINDRLVISLAFDDLNTKVEPLLTKEIVPTKPIQELLNDSVLQLWVKQGVAYHRAKRTTCAFCRKALPDDIWQRLDEHFNKESDDLDNALSGAIDSVKQEAGNIEAAPIRKEVRSGC